MLTQFTTWSSTSFLTHRNLRAQPELRRSLESAEQIVAPLARVSNCQLVLVDVGPHDEQVVESSWRSRIWAAVRSAPLQLKVPMLGFVLLLLASVLCMVLQVRSL